MKNLLMTIIAIFGMVSISMAQLPSYVPTNGIIGWWPFNGNANDESINGNDGNISGASLTEDRFGDANSAYGFDGVNDFMELNSNDFCFNQNTVTLSFWTNVNSWTDNGGFLQAPIIQEGGNHIYHSQFGPQQSSNEILINFQFQNRVYEATIPNTGANFIGIWNHLLLSIDDISGFSIYLNGSQLPDTNSYSYGNSACDGILIWGREINPAGEFYYSGKIDDIGIWNRALNQQEIDDIFNSSNCSNNLTITPAANQLEIGSTANFIATTSDTFPSYVWQSDFGQGFQTLNNYGNYSGVNSNSLSISNVQLSEHNQPIRVISTSGECIDTSNVATININDTCIVTINDTITTLISVTDTLVINTLITGLTPPNNLNTIKVFPNPTNDHITIDFGNFGSMNGYTLKITNSIGQTVYITPVNQQSSYVDLSTWSGNGIYFVQVIDTQNNTIENRKIVLQ